MKIEGSEYSNTKAIYISNHASPIDIFLIMWLTPTGTVGIAKKEVYNWLLNIYSFYISIVYLSNSMPISFLIHIRSL